jgi:hypothetical protein
MKGLLRRPVSFYFAGYFLCAVTVLLLGISAYAAPVRYIGFTITDGKLGAWEFHNARVYLTFQSDTKYVEFLQVPIDPNDPNCQPPLNLQTCSTIDINFNQTGKASATIVSGEKVVHATFAPHQVFVSFDLGDTPSFQTGRGVGFGSFSATAPGGLEPAYPLGIEDGTLHRIDILRASPSPELAAMPVDLKHDSVFSGRAWICVNFPSDCQAPNALATDKGDLYLDLPYFVGSGPPRVTASSDSLSTAIFVVQTGKFEDESSGVLIPREKTTARFKNPITYHAFVTADASLDGKLYTGAQVYLSFNADVSTAVPYVAGPPNSFINAVGDAHVTIVSGGRAVLAEFDPGQIYVYYDVGHASIGFGSVAGKSGYPLTITAKQDPSDLPHILDGQTSVQAVSDIALNNDPDAYSPETASLVTDLTNETALSGPASSCISFDPTTSFCHDLTAIPLATDHGPFKLFESYTVDQNGDGSGIFSANWGVFWSELGRPRRDD